MSPPPSPAPGNDRLLRALRGEPVDRTPVWFMRQAGRHLAEYREIRSRHDFQEVVADPELTARVTALPVERYAVDAAVLFMDLSTPFSGAGLKVEFRSGVGPVVDRPIRGPDDVEALEPFEPREALPSVLESIRLLQDRINVPVIGFVGGPFTLCSYLMAGPRRERLRRLKNLMWAAPAAWDRLADYWSRHLAEFGLAQHEAGAAAIQVFDSWAGELAPGDYEAHVLPHSRRLLERLSAAGVPTIHFFTGNPRLLAPIARAGGDAIGVDWRIPLDEAWEAIGHDCAIQGNLDPDALRVDAAFAVRRARDVLRRAAGRPGHIFNLGHGVLPDTDPSVVEAVVDAVHAHELRS